MVLLYMTCEFDIVSIIFKVYIICHDLIYQYIYWHLYFFYIPKAMCVFHGFR